MRGVRATECIAIQHAWAIRIGHHQIEARRVGFQIETDCIQRLSRNEGKALGFVAESGRAVISQEAGIVTHQEQVRIVVVIVIEPDGLAERPARQFSLPLETAADVAVEESGDGGDHGQIRQAVVIEIARGDRHHVAQVLQPGIGHGLGAIAK